jgi:hypothetical protein
MELYYIFEIMDGDDGYSLFLHKDEEIVTEQANANINFDEDHYRMGCVEANSVDHVLYLMTEDLWEYEEHNQ